MTGSSLTLRVLATLAAVVMVAGIAAANQSTEEVASRTEDLEEQAGAVDELAATADETVPSEEEPSAVDEVGDALAATAEAIAQAAAAVAGAVGSAAGAVGHGLAAAAGAIGDAIAATGQALWTGILLVGEGLAWLGSSTWAGLTTVAAGTWTGLTTVATGTWAGVTAVASGLAWLTTRTGQSIAWIGVNAGHGIADLGAWLGHTIADGALAAGDAWPSDPKHQAIVAGSAGTAAAAGGAWYTGAWRYLKTAPLLAPLYSRISRDELLEHPKRAAIYEAIEDEPGIHLSELSRELDLSWGTLLHHLRKLEKADLVTSDEAQGKRCFFLPGQVSSEERSILPALENEKARRIAEFYLDNPGASQSEAAEDLGYSPALISWHLSKLEDAGVVERERVGRRQRVGVTQEAQAVVAA